MDENIPYSDEYLLKYLDGELPEEEVKAFELELQRKAGLQQAVERFIMAKKAVSYFGLRQQVAHIHQQQMKHKKSPAKIVRMAPALRTFLAIAASVIVIVVGAAVLYISTLNSDKMYSQVFVDYTVAPTRSAASETALKKAYQQNHFSEVIQISKSASLSDEEKLLTGMAYLKTNRFSEAIPQLAALQSSAYAQDAQFYLALCYLKTKQYNQALKLFRQIKADKNHLYHSYITAKQIRDIQLLQWK